MPYVVDRLSRPDRCGAGGGLPRLPARSPRAHRTLRRSGRTARRVRGRDSRAPPRARGRGAALDSLDSRRRTRLPRPLPERAARERVLRAAAAPALARPVRAPRGARRLRPRSALAPAFFWHDILSQRGGGVGARSRAAGLAPPRRRAQARSGIRCARRALGRRVRLVPAGLRRLEGG